MSDMKELRMTGQRRVILEELKKLKSHPTADELYEIVKKKLPRISLSTVYRNLETMADSGSLRKLDLGGGRMRFDAMTANHYHVRCVLCGKVDDLEIKLLSKLDEKAGKISDYNILGHNLEFTGICPACLQKAKSGHRK